VVTDSGVECELVWPDYSGETIRQIIQERRVDERWRDRIRQSEGWMLLVRPQLILEKPDVWERPHPPSKRKKRAATAPTVPTVGAANWHDQASLVELLQILLFVSRTNLSRRVNSPVLAVGLSCWDELPPERQRMRPRDLLRNVVPLLADFTEANWNPTRLAVYGISATGKTLRADVPDDEFQDFGAHTRGWVIDEDGVQTPDLTMPIARLIESAISQ
jgi:hypothetical protein